MNGMRISTEELNRFSETFGLGFYRVTFDGQFIECDSKARMIFSIPTGRDIILSRYSIKDFYVSPEERDIRIKRLMKHPGEPFCGTLSIKVQGENKLLFDICRYEESIEDNGNYIGFILEIEYNIFLFKIFDHFPMGVYEVDNDGKLLRVNRKFVEILGYKNEIELIGRNIKEIYEKKEKFDDLNNEIKINGFAQRILNFINFENRIIEIECFSKSINDFNTARWGMINDVTERERNLRLLNDLPTGYYYIENDLVADCNDQFARILGFKDKSEILGTDTRRLIASNEQEEKYFSALNAAFAEGKPLQKYHLGMRRKNDNEIITISIDVKLIKDNSGNIIGREGTIRDVTKNVVLRRELYNTRENLRNITEDTNRLIHTFLHPVLKFTGNSELLHQMSQALHKSFQSKISNEFDHKTVSKKLMDELIRIRDNLNLKDKECLGVEKNETLIVVNLDKQLTKIINLFDLSLQAKQNNFLMESSLRDTALWIMEKLNNSEYKQYPALKSIIPDSFIEFLREILFHYLTRGAQTLVGETEIMKRGVETIRSGIGLKSERKYGFVRRDVILILEKNIELFKPVFAEENMHIDYVRPRGEFSAEISQSDIDRVICNLMQNALKYSFKGTGRYIKIRAKDLHYENKIEFSIENFGVPIKKEEIENGKIWEYGYRGELAYLNDREGTGIGLADAKEVIDIHNGEISISSEPAPGDWKKNEYNVPYITKVTVKIPRLRQRKV